MTKRLMDEMAAVPLRFWQTMSDAEFMKLATEQHGVLNAEQCARLWRMEDRQGEPPEELEIVFKAEDIDRTFPPKKPKRIRPA